MRDLNIFKNAIKYFLITLPLLLMVYYLNDKLSLGLSDNEINNFFMPLFVLLYFFLFFPDMRKSFLKHFIKTKSLDKLIALPILLAIVDLVLSYTYMFLPVFFDKNPIMVGTNQYIAPEQLSYLGKIMLKAFIGPFNEEVIFRFLFIFFIPYKFLYNSFIKEVAYNIRPYNQFTNKQSSFIDRIGESIYYKAFYFKDNKIIILWVIFISTLFSLGHGLVVYSLPLYFFSGLIYSYLFLKYGLLSSWIAHGFGNALSPIILQIFISILFH